jgi:hypothetical protein
MYFSIKNYLIFVVQLWGIHIGDSLQRHCVFLLNISKEIQIEII